MPSINSISGCVMVLCADIYSPGPNPVLNPFGEELDEVILYWALDCTPFTAA